MNTKIKTYLENYETVSEEIKHITNSLVRLHLLFSLYEQDRTMKEINSTTGLSYSAISSNIHTLEGNGYVMREGNRYFLSNIMKFYLKNLMEFNKTIAILKEFFNIFENHKVRGLPSKSIEELYMVEECRLLESCGTNAYKINKIILDTVEKSHSLKAILPISFQELTDAIVNRADENGKLDLKLSADIYDLFSENIGIKNDNIKISVIRGDLNFLLMVTDEAMILGLYRKDGSYDQNRVLMSKSENALRWANMLFGSF